MYRENSLFVACFVLLVLLNVFMEAKRTTKRPKAATSTETGENANSSTNGTDIADLFFKLATLFSNQNSSESSGKSPRTQYRLFTLKNKNESQTITNETNLNDTNWNPNNDVIFIIHGYVQTTTADLVPAKAVAFEQLKDAYMETGRTENIVIVDATQKGRQLVPSDATKSVQTAGENLAEMLMSLKRRKFFSSFYQVRLIGFSTSAHVAGVAASQISEKTNKVFPRITGLDPAGQGFDESVDAKLRLDKTDADFVDIIHCNTGKWISGKGAKFDSGHVDFFPNGGAVQPGCSEIDFKQKGLCSHMLCVPLYAKTVRGVEYLGCECENAEKWNKGECTDCDGPPMGDFCPTSAKGRYFLNASLDDAR